MLPHQTSKGLNNAISLQELADGHSPCGSPVFPMIFSAGQEAPHANHSAPQVSSSGSSTSDTLPQHLCALSLSAVLQSSLANRLRRRLESTGSMIYSMSWKEKNTPAGRQYCQRLALVPRIKETDYSLVRSFWNTPAASDGLRGGTGITKGMTGSSLSQLVKMAAWPSPCAQNGTVNGYQDWQKVIKRKEAGRQQNLQDVVILAAWPTPTANDFKGSGKTVIRKDGKNRTYDRLDYATEQGLNCLPEIPFAIRLTASGQILTGSAAKMENLGRLRPEHSRWLMGFPPEWDACAVTVTR